jgi:hypothetical protein
MLFRTFVCVSLLFGGLVPAALATIAFGRVFNFDTGAIWKGDGFSIR